ncbi:FAD-binding oxidoreductase [Thalassococcus sp. S3]|uniref:NAD(P)/FAD-dependent oxidoreductase n=1 Tax=Thalassococcus sp. S3 TaxID=2017482 RepID=UPI001024134E|nr:FAD-binding oxidoreductase [Thalassococcus sp. S3]QBF29718.1 FAD-dependent oxidoreductase [Thalassococcus sp. S3]
MRRLYGAYAYGPGPRNGCWWDETVPRRDWPVFEGGEADVGIVGAGFTGLSAALALAEAGASVTVLEAETPGWGASGRNGGFCCLGGAKISATRLAHRYGAEDAEAYWQAERDAVTHVADLLERLGIDADMHSQGETQLAHNPRAMARLRADASPEARVIEAKDLAGEGLAGPFFGAVTEPYGFALNPRKYLHGLASAAERAGARIFAGSPVTDAQKRRLQTATGILRCDRVIWATNGYSSEEGPGWMAGRYLPTQSNVMVTRPITPQEQEAQGWTSGQMAYDTRNLLHYFRLMPDGRFLFGMRGGIFSSPRAEERARRRLRRDFERMFPAWRQVETTHHWSGMVCLSPKALPFAGSVPGAPDILVGQAYHGNGVAMGSFLGHQLGQRSLGRPAAIPRPIAEPPRQFPLGRFRRALVPPLYAALALRDL